MENIFDAKVAQSYIARINTLTPESPGRWGTMTVDQMLAHCNVTYELVFEPQKHKKPGPVARFVLKTFVKPKVVNELPYRQNIPASPFFGIAGTRDFEKEKKRLIGFIQKTQQLGTDAFEGKESYSFGKLSAAEWTNMFAKHLNHHLSQFGV